MNLSCIKRLFIALALIGDASAAETVGPWNLTELFQLPAMQNSDAQSGMLEQIEFGLNGVPASQGDSFGEPAADAEQSVEVDSPT